MLVSASLADETAGAERGVQGKTVLITGGAKRVGAAICRGLHAAGANLMLHYRASAGEARLLSAELNHTRPNSVALIQADLLDIGKLPSLVEQTVQTYGRLDALVNNASSYFQTPLGEITPDAWSDLIGTNLQAPLFLAQAAAPALKKTQGAIVNITDIHAERPLKNYVAYSVAKAGLVGLTRSLARELAPEVRVNAVAPGPIWTRHPCCPGGAPRAAMELPAPLTSARCTPADARTAIARSTAYPLPMPPRSISTQSDRKRIRLGAMVSICSYPTHFRAAAICSVAGIRPASWACFHVLSRGAIVTSNVPPDRRETLSDFSMTS